jgi:riboflavin synthase
MGGSTRLAGSATARQAVFARRRVPPATIPGACGRQVAPEENEVDAVFTGIVEELGEVVALEEFGDSARLTVRGPLVTAGAAAGDSIAINGVCLTVTGVGRAGHNSADGTFSADVMGETLGRSSLGALSRGSAVNLERPMPLGGRLGGHLVQGHVDGTGTIVERRAGAGRSGGVVPPGQARDRWDVVRISIPPSLARYVVEKGSIAVDGISLTISALGGDWIEVSLIPETLARTTLGLKQPGDVVNLEVDMIAKYVERLLGGGVWGRRPAAGEHGGGVWGGRPPAGEHGGGVWEDRPPAGQYSAGTRS